MLRKPESAELLARVVTAVQTVEPSATGLYLLAACYRILEQCSHPCTMSSPDPYPWGEQLLILTHAPTGEDVCAWIDRGSLREYRDRFWTLDPIDGTKGFLRCMAYPSAAGSFPFSRYCVHTLATVTTALYQA